MPIKSTSFISNLPQRARQKHWTFILAFIARLQCGPRYSQRDRASLQTGFSWQRYNRKEGRHREIPPRKSHRRGTRSAHTRETQDKRNEGPKKGSAVPFHTLVHKTRTAVVEDIRGPRNVSGMDDSPKRNEWGFLQTRNVFSDRTCPKVPLLHQLLGCAFFVCYFGSYFFFFRAVATEEGVSLFWMRVVGRSVAIGTRSPYSEGR